MPILRQAALLVLASLLLWQACQGGGADAEKAVLATVHGKSLYMEDLRDMVPPNISERDSAILVQSLLERWVREAVLLHEAEQNVPADLDIDQLVRDYRASLIVQNYERQLVESELDSSISEQEWLDYYEQNKDQYVLNSTIIRCHFVKISQPVLQEEQVRQWWESSKAADRKALLDYCIMQATAFSLEDSTWYNVDEVAAEFPKGTLSARDIGSKRSFVIRDNDYAYYFRLLDYKSEQEMAPMSYVKEQARKYILHRRKLSLLEDKKEQLYNEALKKGLIERYDD